MIVVRVAVTIGRRRKGFLRIQFECVTLFECLKEIEKLNFEFNRRKQSHDHRFTQFQQGRTVDFIVSKDFLKRAQVRFA